MSARWHCRVLDQELGPLDYTDLVQLVRDGTLAADDPVRREGAMEWRAAETVVGLFHAARTAPAASDIASSSPVESSDAPESAAARSEVDNAARHVVSDLRHSPRSHSWNETQDASEPDDAEEAGPLRRALRWGFVGALVLVAVALGWSEWGAYAEVRRFPLPAALRESGASAGHQFLGWGPLSLVEYLLLWMDVLAVAAFGAYLLWRPRRR